VCEGQEPHVVVGHGKGERAESIVTALVVRRSDDAVDGGFVESAGQKVHHVPGVDDLPIHGENVKKPIGGDEEDGPAHCQCVGPNAICGPVKGSAGHRRAGSREWSQCQCLG